MKILLWANHSYGACFTNGTGRTPRDLPSGSGHFLHDLLAKGLGELGHEVYYYLEKGVGGPLPPGVTLVDEPQDDAEIAHTYSSLRCSERVIQHAEARGIPWLATCHLDIQGRGIDRGLAGTNWIFVSKMLGGLYGSERVVYNGIDPADYLYSEQKSDYFLFMSNMDWAHEKGLGTALELSRRMGFKLVVAGTSGKWEVIRKIEELCARDGAEYVGDVRGERKAELFTGARALLHPSQLNEAFGLVAIEALMCGTPVISSDRGASGEVISPEVGFICRGMADYENAIEEVGRISSAACREKAERDYHYLQMARGFLREYRAEIEIPSINRNVLERIVASASAPACG